MAYFPNKAGFELREDGQLFLMSPQPPAEKQNSTVNVSYHSFVTRER